MKPTDPAFRNTAVLTPGAVDLPLLRRIHGGGIGLSLDPSATERMRAAQAAIRNIVDSDKVVYGINTGFGKLASTRISNDYVAELQRNLVLSHSVGTGASLAPAVVRLVLATKVVSLARGHSGVRPALVEALLALFNAGITPRIPAKGSVGASGDLAPLAHLACVLIGEGEALSADGKIINGAEAMALVGLEPFVLGAKEGLALLNGTQVSTALALSGLFGAEDVFASALISGALSLEAIHGSIKPLDPRIHEARGQAGQIAVAAAVLALLEGSEIVPSHADCGRVQDPYSVRCIPQVMGACLDNLMHAARVVMIEANAASDNPLVFFDTGEVISGGNFHAEPVAFAADILKAKGMIEIKPGDYNGTYMHYGVREHGMAAAMNGIALHGGLIPYGGTFLCFSDYCRPSIRLAALMQVRTIFVMTHDSIGLGEDGPTHQPVEQLAALRAIPHLAVYRPGDPVETAECWEIILNTPRRAALLALSRQPMPLLRREAGIENRSAKGGYVLKEAAGGERKLTILSTASELHLAVEARDILQKRGIPTAVVSMPCRLLFEDQNAAYKKEVLGSSRARVAVEAAVELGWERYIGLEGRFVGMHSFGASGKIADVYKKFDINANAVVRAALETLEEVVAL
jgi:transketolase C-terminal domain/subunit